MPEQLSSTERNVYHFLLDFLSEHTYQPSIREIGRTFQIKSTKTVSEILQSLARKGYIERDASRSRGVRILGYEVARRTQPVPYYGKIAAGEPALLPENQQGFITMDRRFLPREDVFFLKIAGDSMVGRGIHNNDYILVLPASQANDGEIVAARIGEDATVKTITYRDGQTVLVPANPADREIVVDASTDFSLLGTVCGVFRPFQEVNQ